jgi:hypothetical protein
VRCFVRRAAPHQVYCCMLQGIGLLPLLALISCVKVHMQRYTSECVCWCLHALQGPAGSRSKKPALLV